MSERPQTTLHKKYPLQFYLNTLGTTLHRWKPYAMLSKNIQTTLHKKKFLCNVLLILFGQNCIAENPVQCSPRGSRQLCIRKMSNSMLPAYAILVLCNLVPEAPSNITQEIFRQCRQCRLNNFWSLSLHMYISGPARQKI